MPRPPRHPAILLVAILLALLAPRAHAADDPPRKPQRPLDTLVSQLAVDWGLDGHVPAGRWTPITFWVASGEVALSGVLEVEHAQDQTQPVRVRVPFATTPGRTIPVEVCTFFPRGADRLTATFYTSEGTRRLDFAAVPGASEIPMPRPDASERRLAMIARVPFLSGSFAFKDERWGWVLLSVARVRPESMPNAWQAYDGVVAVAFRSDLGLVPDAPASAAQLDALLTWIRAGGHAIVLLDDASDAHRRFLDDPGAVEIADARAVPTAPAVTQAFAAIPGDKPAPAATLRARSISVTRAGRDAGWTSAWPLADQPGALLASGPCGFGMVTLVAFNPAGASAVVSDDAARAVWRALVQHSLPDRLDLPKAPTPGTPAFTYTENRADSAQQATAMCFDAISSLPRVGDGLFVALAACILALALAVGPIDAFLLRRLHQRHRSWATALAWAALASLVAYVVPNWLRSGSNREFHLRVIDSIHATDGTPLAAASTGLAGLFAGASSRYAQDHPPPAVFVRGVSPTYDWYEWRQRRRATLAPVVLHASTDTTTGLRRLPLASTDQGQWTFRALLDEAPPVGPLPRALPRLAVKLDPDDHAPIVRFDDLPQGVTVTQVVLRTRAGWRTCSARTPERPGSQAFVAGAPSGTSHPWAVPIDPASGSIQGSVAAGMTGTPGVAFHLHSAHVRSRAQDARLAAGTHAIVHAVLADVPPDFVIAGERGARWESTGSLVLRAAVPLPPGFDDASSAPDAPEPPTTPRPTPEP